MRAIFGWAILHALGVEGIPPATVPNVPGWVNGGTLGDFPTLRRPISRVASVDVNKLERLYTRAVAIRWIVRIPVILA